MKNKEENSDQPAYLYGHTHYRRNTMRILLGLIALAHTFSLGAYADHHEGEGDMKGKKFEEVKSMMLEHIEKRMGHLTEMKTCVNGAADKEVLKACRMKHREVMKGHREMRKEMRDKRKAARKAKKEG
jgi:hypothetical protein